MKLPEIVGLAVFGSALCSGQVLAQAANTVEEVLVTAEKRAEPIQNVPVAVTVLTGAQLDALSLNTLPEVARVVPGVQLQLKYGPGRPTFVIRGVALLDYNANNAPAAAIYVDDVYQPSTAMGGVSLFDLDRVEILKGPQGGLFGRDTSGGAVQVISTRPDFGRASGYAKAGFGRWNVWSLEGASNLPITDTLAVRISALREKGNGGWQYSLTDRKHWGAPDRTGGRVQVRYAPTPELDVNLKVEGSWNGSEVALARAVALYTRTGAFCAPALAGRRDDAGCFTLNQATRVVQRLPAGAFASEQARDGSTTLSHAFNRLKNRNRAATLSGTYHFDGFDLVSISGWNRFHYGQNYDFAASPDRMALQIDRTDFESVSQELRLLSTGDGRFSWLLGANWAQDNLTVDRAIDIRDNLMISPTLGIKDPRKAVLQLGYNQDTRYAAAFGQADYRVLDTVTVSGTLRYSDHTKRYYDGSVSASRPYLVTLTGLESRYELDDDLTGKASIDWRPAEGVMGYASVARGYKSGGVFGGFNQVAGQVRPYDEETVWAYEAGFKLALMQRRAFVSGAVFHYDYSDAQGFTNVQLPTTTGLTVAYPVLTNLGDAKHDGAELEATVNPVTGLTLQGGLAYLTANWENTNGLTYLSPEGIRVPQEGRTRAYAPKWSGFGLVRYEADLSQTLNAAAQVDANFRSDQTFPKTAVERAIGGVEAFSLLNGRLTFTLTPQQLSLSVWGRNLSNERYRTEVGSDGLGSYTETFGEPRSYGIEIAKRW